jgi:C-terminal processing protease CtpA/Prc
MKNVLLNTTIALCLFGSSLQAKEVDTKRQAALQAEMQQLTKRMTEISKEMAASGDKSATAYAFKTDEFGNLDNIQIEGLGDLKNLEALSSLTRQSTHFALGTLLKARDGKVFIEAVTPGSGAEKAGINANDQLVSIRGKAIAPNATVDQVRALIGELKSAEQVPVVIMRDDQTINTTVTASAQPRISMIRLDRNDPNIDQKIEEALQQLPNGAGAQRIRTIRINNGAEADLDMVTISPDLSAYFGTTTGVLVLDAKGYAPMLGGDVITAIDNQVVNSPRDVASKLASKRGGSVSVSVIRQKTPATLTVAVPNLP